MQLLIHTFTMNYKALMTIRVHPCCCLDDYLAVAADAASMVDVKHSVTAAAGTSVGSPLIRRPVV